MADLRFSSKFEKDKVPKFKKMIFRALGYFPELEGLEIKVGTTKTAIGLADKENHYIWLNPKVVRFYVIGHELTHLVQGDGGIPSGEVECDIWTLARNELFLDRFPWYLSDLYSENGISLGNLVAKHWHDLSHSFRECCIATVYRYNSHGSGNNEYLKVLKRELANLVS